MPFAEKPVLLGPDKDQLGIISVPAQKARRSAVLLMNAGLIHRVGPNRLNVELARRAAELGFVTLRLDLAGFGDSKALADGRSFEAAAVRDLRAAMDHLSAHWNVERFIPIGLCSGADVSLKLAAADPRIERAGLIDCFAYDTRLFLAQGYAHRALRKESWKSFVGGDSDLRRRLISKVGRLLAPDGAEAQRAEAALWKQPPLEEIVADLEAALAHGARLLFAYSGGPAYYNYLLRLRSVLGPHKRSAKVVMKRFPESDHTFTMIHHRRQLIEELERWLSAG
jgi:hypothetical protein